MTDTPATSSPPSRLDEIKGFVGDLARPFCLIASGFSSAWVTIAIVATGADLISGAAFIAAAWAGTGALYGAKAWENWKAGKQAAEVRLAEVHAPAQGLPHD